MARKHYWQFLVTDEGVPVENAQISVYLAGTNDPVWIYTDEFSIRGTAIVPQTISSLKGYFEFWIADESDTSHGYDISTKFKIAWSATGVSSGYIDHVDIFSTFIQKVDVTDDSDLINKMISNSLAKGWESHKNSVIVDGEIHGISSVNTDSSDDVINKLISNYQGHTWELHSRTMYNGDVSTAISPNLPTSVHGIEQVDLSDTVSITKNKLVSNQMARLWNDHANDVTVNPHPQYVAIDGSTSFTEPVGYADSSIIYSASPDDFVTLSYVDNKRYVEYIPSLSFMYDAITKSYYYDIVHGTNTQCPIIQCWDNSTSYSIVPVGYKCINDDTVRVFMYTNTISLLVRVIT